MSFIPLNLQRPFDRSKGVASVHAQTGPSSNGRTADFGSVNGGSNPPGPITVGTLWSSLVVQYRPAHSSGPRAWPLISRTNSDLEPFSVFEGVFDRAVGNPSHRSTTNQKI